MICGGLNRHALSGPNRWSGRSNKGAFFTLRSDCTLGSLGVTFLLGIVLRGASPPEAHARR
jgi:hypothetical protein